MKRSDLLEVVGLLLVCVSVWLGGGVAVVFSSWLAGVIGGVFLVVYAIAWER